MLHRLRTLALSAAIPAAMVVAMSAQSASAATLIYSTTFTPLNGSSVQGGALFTLSENRNFLDITIQATGLEPGGVHPGHIHGRFSNVTTGTPIDSFTPTLAQDSDRDGFIEVAEGVATYGPIIISFGNVDPDLDGVVNFSQRFNLNAASTFDNGYTKFDLLGPTLDRLDLREVVLHGKTVPAVGAGTPGEVNGVAGYKAALPVASGEIMSLTGTVPEPSTWAMMLLGFGFLGGAMRRRNRADHKQRKATLSYS